MPRMVTLVPPSGGPATGVTCGRRERVNDAFVSMFSDSFLEKVEDLNSVSNMVNMHKTIGLKHTAIASAAGLDLYRIFMKWIVLVLDADWSI